MDELLLSVEKIESSSSELKDAGYRDGQVVLVFSDGRELSAQARDLRANCACALCISEVTGQAAGGCQQDPGEDINPQEILPLGNYAVGITWSDGHSSGIYPYSMFS